MYLSIYTTKKEKKGGEKKERNQSKIKPMEKKDAKQKYLSEFLHKKKWVFTKLKGAKKNI